MPQTQKIQLAPITAWTLVKWFLIPGLILAYITLYPPHALDIALSEPFYNGTKFALNRIPVRETMIEKRRQVRSKFCARTMKLSGFSK